MFLFYSERQPSLKRGSSTPGSSSGVSRQGSYKSPGTATGSSVDSQSSARRRQLSKQKSTLRQSTQDKTKLTSDPIQLIEEESAEVGGVSDSVFSAGVQLVLALYHSFAPISS